MRRSLCLKAVPSDPSAPAVNHLSEGDPRPPEALSTPVPVESPAAPAVDREAILVEALLDYLAEIEATQVLLLDISRRALSVAIEVLGGDSDGPDSGHVESAGDTPGPPG